MEHGLISVLIPVYNVEQYLERCLDSVMASTYQQLEIICVDDGSTDRSGMILDRYAAKDNRIKAIHQENTGLSGARNTGLEEASGEYISFIDSDDWIHPCFFEYLMRVMEKENADVVDSGFAVRYPGEELKQEVTFSYHKVDNEVLLKGVCWRRIFRRKVAEQIRFRKILVEDRVYNMEVLEAHPDLSMFVVDAVLFAYFQRSDSLTAYLTPESHAEWMQIYLDRAKNHRNSSLEKKLVNRVRRNALNFRYENMLCHDQHAVQVYQKMLWKTFTHDFTPDFPCLIMTIFPFVYRSFRLKQDPSLREYERRMRMKSSQHMESR